MADTKTAKLFKISGNDVLVEYARQDQKGNTIDTTYLTKVDAESIYVKKEDKASTTAFGVVKVGTGLEINSTTGALDVVSAGKVDWTGVENKPFNTLNSSDFVTTGGALAISSATWLSNASAKETYETIANVKAKIEALDYTSKGAEGSYVQKVSETDGVISETIKAFDSTIASGSTSVNAPSSKAVEARIQEVIGGLDVASVGADGKYIQLVSETEGKISATAKAFDTAIDSTASDNNVPTTKAIKSYVDDLVAAGVDIEVVETLPTASKSTKGKIYLVKHEHTTGDSYDEYVTVQSGTGESATYAWEKIGNTDIDLSAYVKGSNLTSDKVVLGNGGVNVKASSYGIVTTIGTDNTTIPTSKAVVDKLAEYVLKTTKVNGHALSSDVTITKGDVELGNVVNTGDSATPVANGTTKFTTGGAYTLQTTLQGNIDKKQDKLTEGNGISISSNTVAVKLATGESALVLDANGLSSVFSFEDVTIG